MNNKGQTTVFFSLIISVLLLFTFTALEVVRIHMSKVKMMACVHSMRSSILADYNSELFERYHLLFIEPTYGTGSEAAAEEKVIDYLESSLNGEAGTDQGMYRFEVEEIMLTEQENILEDNMKLLKNQITDYEKTSGLVNRIKGLVEKTKKETNNVADAVKETEINGVELDLPQGNTGEGQNDSASQGNNRENQSGKSQESKVEDPRETLKEALKFGVLAFLMPDSDISKEERDFCDAPSARYEEEKEEERDTGFQSIAVLKDIIKGVSDKTYADDLKQQAAFVDYVSSNFSNAVNQREDSVAKCEIEYILKGKSNDYDNLEAVINEMIWLRMPINYAYLLTDTEKKSEALTMAAAICTATGTSGLIEVVKYLLLGCWAYGESLYEMKSLLAGEKIAYRKTKDSWNTELKKLFSSQKAKEAVNGLNYEEYLMLLLAGKSGDKLNTAYARMLDMMELNLQKEDPDFYISNCVGQLTIQGKITVNPLFRYNEAREVYEYYFEEEVAY